MWVVHALDGYKLGRIVDIGADGVTVELLEKPPGQRLSAPFDSTFPAEELADKDVDDNCEYVASALGHSCGLSSSVRAIANSGGHGETV